MRQTHLSHQIVETIPERLEEGVLYVSLRYGTALHKCACGCGEEVVTPINPTDWSIRFDQSGVTLHPSIGNWSFACQSHYLIQRGKIVWAGRMTQQQIDKGREFDRQSKEQYFSDVNRNKGFDQQSQQPGILASIWAALKRWWNP
jgi:hypothetical protein